MKAYWVKWICRSTHSLTSALDGGEWSASHVGRFTPRERDPGTHWIGGWVGPRAVLDAVKRKIPSPYRESNPRTPIVQPVAQCYTDWAITALFRIALCVNSLCILSSKCINESHDDGVSVHPSECVVSQTSFNRLWWNFLCGPTLIVVKFYFRPFYSCITRALIEAQS
jgi:hypothetical protein